VAIEMAVDAGATTIEAIVDAIAAVVEPALNAVTSVFQVCGASIVSECFLMRCAGIEAVVDAVAAIVETIFDTVPTVVQMVFDAIAAIQTARFLRECHTGKAARDDQDCEKDSAVHPCAP
jgi:phage-related protein